MQPKVIILRCDGVPRYFIWDGENYVSLTERILNRQICSFQDFTVEAKEKRFKKWIEGAEIVCIANISSQLPNARAKIHTNGKKHSPTKDDLRQGVKTLLAFGQLFEEPLPGHLLLADTLCGMHLTALREAEPSFQPRSGITSYRPEIEAALRAFTGAVAPRSHWDGKRCKVKRNAILAYDAAEGMFPAHIQDHSRVKLTPKRAKGLQAPFAYTDTLALVIGANSTQIREAAPFLENAAVILLNSASGDLNPTKLSSSDIEAYDPAVLERLTAERHHVAALLRWWWGLFADEDAWARHIVQAARASFGKPDSRYIKVELDPKKLRDAIRYRVLLSFLDELESARFMTAEELAPYRQTAKDVFDPDPPEPVQLRHAEDQDVFLEVMRDLVKNPPAAIVAENERFVKRDKPLAAWRTIRNELHLVFLESSWAQAYAKAVRTRAGIDSSFFQHEHWERDIQKLLCEQGLIKAPSSGSRYRYDLLDNNTRDSTYVVAVPARLLEN